MASESAETWLAAAYERFVDAGLAAVRVEAVARDIGATKGSFYWHFANRQALIDAVVARWEQEETDRIIELADRAGPPEERLASLYELVGAASRGRRGERTLYTEAAGENVQETAVRVSQRRVDYVAGVLAELGFDAAEARRRATVAVAVAVGLQQLSAAGWRDSDRAGLTETLLRMTLDR